MCDVCLRTWETMRFDAADDDDYARHKNAMILLILLSCCCNFGLLSESIVEQFPN